jgi:hypothetical protein
VTIISDKKDTLRDIFLSLEFRLFNPNGFIFEPIENVIHYGTKNTSGKKRKAFQRDAWHQARGIGL